MTYVYLGNSGFKVSRIILGNWLTHGSSVSEETAHATVHAALDAGITTFDTADAYANTKAEEVLGAALASQRRESLEILSKVYWPTGPKGPNDEGLSRKHILESLHGTLRRLGTDYVDVYQAHRFDTETPLEETMVAFADLVRQGKALYIGVSEWTAEQITWGVELARELRIQLVSNQPQYSLLWRVIEAEVVPACQELGVSQIVWSPLAQGALTGKYLPNSSLPQGSRAAHAKDQGWQENEFLTPDILTAVQQLRPIADAADVSVAQLCLAWVLRNPNVSAAIIGASRPEQVTENARVRDLVIDDAHLDQAESILTPFAVTDPAETVRRAPLTRPMHP